MNILNAKNKTTDDKDNFQNRQKNAYVKDYLHSDVFMQRANVLWLDVRKSLVTIYTKVIQSKQKVM